MSSDTSSRDDCPACHGFDDPCVACTIIDAMEHPERYLSPEDMAEYRRCQQSIIDARRNALSEDHHG